MLIVMMGMLVVRMMVLVVRVGMLVVRVMVLIVRIRMLVIASSDIRGHCCTSHASIRVVPVVVISEVAIVAFTVVVVV